MRGITIAATILAASAAGLATCGRGEQSRTINNPPAPSRQPFESIIAAQRPLRDSSRAEAARTAYRGPTLLAFGFQADSADDATTESGWSPDERRALRDLATEVGARWVTTWTRPRRVTDVTANAVHDLVGARAVVGVLLLRPGFDPVILSRGTSLDRIRAAARDMFRAPAPGARRA